MTKRVCLCSRKEPLAGKRADATFASKACQVRWMRENPGQRLPGRNKAHLVDTRGRSGRQVSYLKLVNDIPEEPMSKSELEAWITSKLSTRQRAQRSKERA